MDKSENRHRKILEYLENRNVATSPQEIISILSKVYSVSDLTFKRDLSFLFEKGYVVRQGKGRSTKYIISPTYKLVIPIDPGQYFKNEIDKRQALERFQFDIFETISGVPVFSKLEQSELNQLAKEHLQQKARLSKTQLKREFERLTIELSWKSSEIEGNTYSLLETESLLQDGIMAKGKSREDAQMLINHKKTLEYIRDNSDAYRKISLKKIEQLHSNLVEELGISTSVRKSLVSITGTKYRPLDNQFQIKEALEKACQFINSLDNVYERAFWAILLISYIQPFEDGNKRTSRMLSTAILLSDKGIPLSYRSVDSQDYKKSVLLFYEKNNISTFKKIFLEQIRFSVKTYFRSTN